MKCTFTFLLAFFLFPLACISNTPEQGFALENSLSGVTLRYKKQKNLIIISPRINDSLQVNLIFDTGCRNVILFGKKFEKYFPKRIERPVVFSGLGEGKPLTGKMSLGNKFTMDGIIGRGIVVVVVPKKHNFSGLENIDGFIGFDLLLKFEIEVNPVESTITFRKSHEKHWRPGFKQFSMRTDDAVPEILAELKVKEDQTVKLPLLIDTGSSFGLIYKTTRTAGVNREVIGRGFNGLVYGETSVCSNLTADGFVLARDLPITVALAKWKNNSSIGMRFLKDYVFVINYSRGYFSLKPIANPEIKMELDNMTL